LAKHQIIAINSWFDQASKKPRLNAVNGYAIGIPLTSREQSYVLNSVALYLVGINSVSNQAGAYGAESGQEHPTLCVAVGSDKMMPLGGFHNVLCRLDLLAVRSF
jgi:hypothetical protein